MRILMLGWEFPPFIAGGLGTACHGLTRGLDNLGHQITFVLPKPVAESGESHVELLSPSSLKDRPRPAHSDAPRAQATDAPRAPDGSPIDERQYTNVSFMQVPATFASPYGQYGPGGAPSEGLSVEMVESVVREPGGLERIWTGETDAFEPAEIEQMSGGGGGAYGSDLHGDSRRYARMVVQLARTERFDVIHAHDWLTYPAGIALRAVSGKPLVCHVHATEFDRSGDHVNQRVYDIERAGMHAADRVVAVSMLTKNTCAIRYGVDADKVDVVYNGVEQSGVQPQEGVRVEADDKIVLFLGRITLQKGPDYFVAAAKRVLEKYEKVKFVVAGSGDMAVRMIEMAADMGIGHKMLFTGFLRGDAVDKVFRMADCYVMPSVSEPFGIAPLEAMRNDTPVIISKQSGVSEVLTHALKADFWDIDDLASKIVSVLKYPALSKTLREHGVYELRRLTWDGAAEKMTQVYHRACLRD